MSGKKIKNTLITLLVLGASLFAISWVLNKNKKVNEEKSAIVNAKLPFVAVKTAKAEKKDIAQSFISNGNFAPVQEISFAAENSGRVVKVLVSEGSRVSIGQTLAVIRTEQLEIDLQTAEVNYQNALREKDRFENAFKTGGVTQQQLDQVKLNLENAKAALDRAKVRMNDAYIRSTINGIVNKKLIEPGSVVNPGTPLFEIVNVSSLKLKVNVTEQQVASIKMGDKVQITSPVIPGRTFSGKISFIAPKANSSLNFPVEIIVENSGDLLRAGMYGTVVFNADKSENLLIIPRAAFVGSINTGEVFVMNSDSTVNVKHLVAGRILGDDVEVLSGIEEGAEVVVSGHINLKENDKIRVIE